MFVNVDGAEDRENMRTQVFVWEEKAMTKGEVKD